MKKLIIGLTLLTILASVTMFTGCIRVDMSEKNDPITTRSYDFTDFTGIEAGSIFELEVTPSDTYRVAVTTGENVLKRIHVSKSGSTLKIEMETWLFSWHTTPKVTITMPELTSLDLSGASQGTVQGFKSTDYFNLKLSGASHLDLEMETGYFTSELSGASSVTGRLTATGSVIDLSGASRIELTGSGGDIKIHGSGASHASLEYFTVNNAAIEFTGASHASLDISGKLDVTLSGASSLEYLGNPTLGKIDTSGASDLEHKTLP